MTVPAQNVAPQAVAAAGQTVFAFSWRCDDSALVVVFVNNVQDGGFTVFRNPDQTATPGGTITRGVACVGGEVVTVERLSPQTQTTALTRYGPFPADTITAMVDKFIMLSQEAASILGKTVKAARASLSKFSSLEMPDPEDGKMLSFLKDPISGLFSLAKSTSASVEFMQAYIQQVLSGGGVVQPLSWTFLGDDVNTDYNIAGALLASPDLYLVTISGVGQEPTFSYTIDLTVNPAKIKFTGIVPLNARVVVRSLGYAKGVNIGDNSLVTATGGTTARKMADRVLFQVDVRDFGAAVDNATDDTVAWGRAYAALPATGGTIFCPSGTSRMNLVISKSHVTIRGAGRRATILKPVANAPCITIDSAGGAIESNSIRDLAFEAAGTGSTSPAIKITGANINDWISVQRVYIHAFTRGINIVGRSIWSRFVDVEITNDLSSGFEVNTASAVNHITLQDVRVGSSAVEGFFFKATGGQIFKTIQFLHCNSEQNAGAGIRLSDVEMAVIDNCYIEENVYGVRVEGTFARALNIRNSLLWGAVTQFAVHITAVLTTGSIDGNFLDASAGVTETLHIAISHADAHLLIGSNYDTKVHNIANDVNGDNHVSSVTPVGLQYDSEAVAPVSVARKNYLAMTNAGAVTINTLPGGERGQLLHILQAGAGTTTLTHAFGGVGQMVFPAAANIALAPGKTASLVYDGAIWRPLTSVAY